MYKEGFVVRLSNNVPLVVTEVHKENNTLVLSDQNGQTYKISGNDLHQATISQQIKTNFADGDRIIFTKALPKENTTNQNGKGKSNLRGVKKKSEGTVLGYRKLKRLRLN